MCLWILTACLGMLPGNPSPIVVVPGVPSPIIVPTAAPTTTTTTTTTTTARPPSPGNMTAAPTMPPTTLPTMPPTTLPPVTTVPTAAPTTLPPVTTVPTAAPTTLPPTTAPTMAPTTPPPMTTVPTAAPTVPPTTLPPVTTVTNVPPTTLPPSPTTMTAAPPTTLPPTVQPTIGPLPIDPRLGTTPPASSAAINMPPITGYSAQVPSYDTAVKFPRSRRSVNRENAINVKDFLNSVQNTDGGHNIVKRQSCACVPTGTCIRNTGAGMIDVRIVTPVQCPTGQEYCCGNTTVVPPIACGKTQTVPATAIAPAYGQASFGEFPWQALILTKQNDYIAGGVLIDALNVITVTHRLLPYIVSGTAPNVKVRMGEWDAAGTYEPVPYQEYTITKVFSHPSYNANTLQNDIMVLRLASAVQFTPAMGAAVTINRACLPPTATTAYTGQRCMVSGWGKNMFGQQGQYQQILKKVDVPIVAPATCQTQLQTARLGATYMLDTTSFICAGGEANKDSCTGDGGSGLVCQVSGSWVVVGLVSWGLGCANANVPGVYVNVAGFLPWIQQQVATA
ncbi:inactive CLIP domain-containing serine protease A3-like isoform X2 [Anticarsia gemmatalis]|uniref:inactive CLIP domain-containing serine protease A3-like isoform X2 n=1 Tax=Anticarsia gemmatalis TaxID=129554 RepID=UPI003F76634B